jgi:hypothetical protein
MRNKLKKRSRWGGGGRGTGGIITALPSPFTTQETPNLLADSYGVHVFNDEIYRLFSATIISDMILNLLAVF